MGIYPSEHKWDNDDGFELLADPPLELVSKTVPSEQYENFEYEEPDNSGFDGFDKVHNTVSKDIGICLIVFSELENSLECNLYALINTRSDQVGRITTRNMEYMQKVHLYIDYLRASLNDHGKSYKDDVRALKKHLIRAGEIRNIIAHAKWPSITSEGYVFSKVDAASISNPMEYRYYKLDKTELDESRSYISWVSNLPFHIDEKYIHNFR